MWEMLKVSEYILVWLYITFLHWRLCSAILHLIIQFLYLDTYKLQKNWNIVEIVEINK